MAEMTDAEQIQFLHGRAIALQDIIEALVEGIPHSNLNTTAVREKLTEPKQDRRANQDFNDGYQGTIRDFLELPRIK